MLAGDVDMFAAVGSVAAEGAVEAVVLAGAVSGRWPGITGSTLRRPLPRPEAKH